MLKIILQIEKLFTYRHCFISSNSDKYQSFFPAFQEFIFKKDCMESWKFMGT